MLDDRSSVHYRHRFPPEIIAEAVWLYFRFPLSFRIVEEMLACRGIIVTHKTVREWTEKFSRDYANTIRRRTPRVSDKWHLDEAVVTINWEQHFLWRSVDHDCFVLGVLIQKRRDTKTARRFIRKLLSGQGAVLRVMVKDKLGSYGANREIGLTVCDHRQHKGLNNRAENSHQPIRRQERSMKRFKSARHLQGFASIHDSIYNLHHFPRDRFTSAVHRELRQTANTIGEISLACNPTNHYHRSTGIRGQAKITPPSRLTAHRPLWQCRANVAMAVAA